MSSKKGFGCTHFGRIKVDQAERRAPYAQTVFQLPGPAGQTRRTENICSTEPTGLAKALPGPCDKCVFPLALCSPTPASPRRWPILATCLFTVSASAPTGHSEQQPSSLPSHAIYKINDKTRTDLIAFFQHPRVHCSRAEIVSQTFSYFFTKRNFCSTKIKRNQR